MFYNKQTNQGEHVIHWKGGFNKQQQQQQLR